MSGTRPPPIVGPDADPEEVLEARLDPQRLARDVIRRPCAAARQRHALGRERAPAGAEGVPAEGVLREGREIRLRLGANPRRPACRRGARARRDVVGGGGERAPSGASARARRAARGRRGSSSAPGRRLTPRADRLGQDPARLLPGGRGRLCLVERERSEARPRAASRRTLGLGVPGQGVDLLDTLRARRRAATRARWRPRGARPRRRDSRPSREGPRRVSTSIATSPRRPDRTAARRTRRSRGDWRGQRASAVARRGRGRRRASPGAARRVLGGARRAGTALRVQRRRGWRAAPRDGLRGAGVELERAQRVGEEARALGLVVEIGQIEDPAALGVRARPASSRAPKVARAFPRMSRAPGISAAARAGGPAPAPASRPRGPGARRRKLDEGRAGHAPAPSGVAHALSRRAPPSVRRIRARPPGAAAGGPIVPPEVGDGAHVRRASASSVSARSARAISGG